MTHITIEREALQKVLDTLEENHHLIEQYERSEYLALYDRQITVIKKALAAPTVQEPVAGLYAVYFRNNWDGEGDFEYVLAYLSEKGEWTLHENGAPLIEFNGDEIIKTWPLTFESATPPAQPAPVQEPDETLLSFYQATDYPSLVAAMEGHIKKMQGKLQANPQTAIDAWNNREMHRTRPAAQPAPKVVDCHATGVCVQSGLRAEVPAPVQDGWKLVPEDPTNAMLRAVDRVDFTNADTDGTTINVWQAMLAAAPEKGQP